MLFDGFFIQMDLHDVMEGNRRGGGRRERAYWRHVPDAYSGQSSAVCEGDEARAPFESCNTHMFCMDNGV